MEIGQVAAWIVVCFLWLVTLGCTIAAVLMGVFFWFGIKDWKDSRRDGKGGDGEFLLIMGVMLVFSIAMSAAFILGSLRITGIML